MSFDPVDFLKISKELLSGDSEAHYRSLINRAYYAAFGHVRNKLHISVSDGSVHKAVIQRLKTSRSPKMKKASIHQVLKLFCSLDRNRTCI